MLFSLFSLFSWIFHLLKFTIPELLKALIFNFGDNQERKVTSFFKDWSLVAITNYDFESIELTIDYH